MSALPNANPETELIGQHIASYRLVRLLGEGGMGLVYQAVQTSTGGPAAVKILRAEVASRRDITERFFNEAKAAAAISHPGIVHVFDCGYTSSGFAYLAMEFLEGETLRQRLQKLGKLRTTDALRVMRQIGSALQAAHKRGVVHRDLKPDNVMLTPDPDLPDGERAKVLDFGVAKFSESNGAQRTRSGIVMGTPTYMAPEQCHGAKLVTAKSDVYSLGVMLYEMLAGRPPFVGEGFGELATMHLKDAPPQLTSLVPEVSPAVAGLVHAMLEKSDDTRPTLDVVLGQLPRILNGLQSAATIPPRTDVPVRPPANTQPEPRQVIPTRATPQPEGDSRPTQPLAITSLASAKQLLSNADSVSAVTRGKTISAAEAWPQRLGEGALAPYPTSDPEAATTRQPLVYLAEVAEATVPISRSLLEGHPGTENVIVAETPTRTNPWRRGVAWGAAALGVASLLVLTWGQVAPTERVRPPEESPVRSPPPPEPRAALSGSGPDFPLVPGSRSTETPPSSGLPGGAPGLMGTAEQPAAGARSTAPAMSPPAVSSAPHAPPAPPAVTAPTARPPRGVERPATSLNSRDTGVSTPAPLAPSKPQPGKLAPPSLRPPVSSAGDGMAPSRGTMPLPATAENAVQILEYAQMEYIDGHYAKAIELAKSVKKYDTIRAWRIIGASGCNLRDIRLANDAYRYLDSPGRQYLLFVCQRMGFQLGNEGFKLEP